MTQKVLIVDDEPGMLEVCRDTLRKLPETEILTESSSERAFSVMATAENGWIFNSDSYSRSASSNCPIRRWLFPIA